MRRLVIALVTAVFAVLLAGACVPASAAGVYLVPVYDLSASAYDGAAAQRAGAPSEEAPVASNGVSDGVQVTLPTPTGPLSPLLSVSTAANTGADVVLYSPQAASRNLLGQLGEGFATTPGGRTVSAHAADRIVNGAAGRGPTTLSRVDDILDSPTALRYDPLRDTVRVSQGKDFVVVRGSGSGQHIVTVMVP